MNKKFDLELKKIDHYLRYPQMLPFIGDEFEKTKLLLIAESHYLPPNSKVILDGSNDFKKWYEADEDTLEQEDKDWIHTRETIKNNTTTMKNLQEVLKLAGENLGKTDKYEYVAFMNCMQRPAGYYPGNIKSWKKVDNEKAREVVQKVVKILQPKAICFVSTKASNVMAAHYIYR